MVKSIIFIVDFNLVTELQIVIQIRRNASPVEGHVTMDTKIYAHMPSELQAVEVMFFHVDGIKASFFL